MYTVKVNGLKYTAFHGLFPEEKLIDNQFELSIEVTMNKKLVLKNNLSDLIDYVFLKDVADKYMNQQFELLEDILAHISKDILEQYPYTKGVLSLKKYAPPFGGRCISSEVMYAF